VIGVGRDGPVGPDAATGARRPEADANPAQGRATALPAAPAVPEASAGHGRRRADGGRDAWAVLASVEGLGPVGLMRLVERMGSPEAAVAAAARPDGERRIREAMDARAGAGLSSRVAAAARDRRSILASIRSAGLIVLTLDDPTYPSALARIELPPPVLFVRGSLDPLVDRPCVAVVGTRRPTDAGRSVAARLAGTLARAGVVVSSGLAVGIDGAAHAATVGVGGTTVAVIGGGHSAAIARRHVGLAAAIVESGGAVVSEHPPWTAPTRGTFPRRNRVISGLAFATVVVEAGTRSGALITAGWALEQGRECFVVPGPIDAPASVGCLGLLRAYPDQVRVVAGVAALVEDLGLAGHGTPRGSGRRPGSGSAPGAGLPVPSSESVLAGLPGPVAGVARSLAGGARSADHVVAVTGLPVPGALAALTMLEDLGLVAASYGRYRLAGALSDLG
jgi:DNA processing protein